LSGAELPARQSSLLESPVCAGIERSTDHELRRRRPTAVGVEHLHRRRESARTTDRVARLELRFALRQDRRRERRGKARDRQDE
jgi:hypothetical protein